MYTSQEGELYVGQARALGAFGVMPKQIEPVEVKKVLRALHLIPDAGGEPIRGADVGHDLENARVGELLEDMFRQQRSMLREEIRKGYERLSETAAQTASHQVLTQSNATRSPLMIAGTLALLLAIAVFAYLYSETATLLDEANGRIAFMVQRQQEVVAATEGGSSVDRDAPASLQEITELLEWGINQGGSYRFGETALDGERAQQFAVLADRLRNAGFRGTVVVNIHLGRYCMNLGDDGTLTLPPTDQLVEDCQQIGWAESEALLLGEQQTLPFANTISVAARQEGIQFQIVSQGSAEPRTGYPLLSQGLTAGAWNDIAARNHRVEVRILPD